MPRRLLDMNVFDAAVERMYVLYAEGHRPVVSFSGGKDSGICVEVCILAAQRAGTLPVDVIMRDEEIMFPGTFEYCARVATRPEVSFHWIYACQPILNVFNRELPFWWVFDPLLPPEQWVRQPPPQAYKIGDINIERMTTRDRFPPAPGKDLFQVIGLRVAESRGRMYGLFSSKGYLTKPNREGVRECRPVYDWTDGDVWKAIKDNGWDYNSAYDVMARMGMPRSRLRIAPPSMNVAGVPSLQLAMRAWPRWFDAMCERLPGIRAAAKYGVRAVSPLRNLNESWEACFKRTCIDTAPSWIADRAVTAMKTVLSCHAHHSNGPLPDVAPCYTCVSNLGSWRQLAVSMYSGDPFSVKSPHIPQVEPDFFRPGSGFWYGKASF
jgi:predicted phosphoadenosine phosphosulfate sulfurtransferase